MFICKCASTTCFLMRGGDRKGRTGVCSTIFPAEHHAFTIIDSGYPPILTSKPHTYSEIVFYLTSSPKFKNCTEVVAAVTAIMPQLLALKTF